MLIECLLYTPQHCGYTVIKPIKICMVVSFKEQNILAEKTDDSENNCYEKLKQGKAVFIIQQ